VSECGGHGPELSAGLQGLWKRFLQRMRGRGRQSAAAVHGTGIAPCSKCKGTGEMKGKPCPEHGRTVTRARLAAEGRWRDE
jgi:DnaJ-class molecular chaperone